MKTLQLTFDNKTFYTTAVQHNNTEFFNLNDIFNASSEVKNSKRPKNWRNKLSYRYKEEGKMVTLKVKSVDSTNLRPREIRTQNQHLQSETWYGTQEVVIAYSQWLQADFAYVVNQAFSLLVEGKVDEALIIAQGVAKIERAKTIETNKELKSAIREAHDAGQLSGQVHHRQIHFANLAFAYATGLSATKAKHLLGTSAPRDYLVEQGDYEAVRKLEEAQVVIKTLLSIGYDYEMTKTHLNVAFK